MTGLQVGTDIQALAIVPMKMIESWMLGDRMAFSRLYEKELDYRYFRTPELIWGNSSDDTSDFPKNKLKRVLLECKKELTRDVYPQIAEKQDIEELCRTCQISFSFFDQVQAISPDRNSKP